MPEVGRDLDALGLYLTGGASNSDPDQSLGGAVSSKQIKGMGPLIATPMPALRIDNVFPDSGEGTGNLLVDANGDLVYTPPGGAAGAAVAIAAGESKTIPGSVSNAAVNVYREAGLSYVGEVDIEMVWPLNGAISHANVTDAQRSAGVTTYRAIGLKAHGTYGVNEVKIWLPSDTTQATYAIAIEAGSIQTIVDETTAPSGLSFVSPTNVSTALYGGTIDVGQTLGLWIRRTFPVGVVSPQEFARLAIQYEGA